MASRDAIPYTTSSRSELSLLYFFVYFTGISFELQEFYFITGCLFFYQKFILKILDKKYFCTGQLICCRFIIKVVSDCGEVGNILSFCSKNQTGVSSITTVDPSCSRITSLNAEA